MIYILVQVSVYIIVNQCFSDIHCYRCRNICHYNKYRIPSKYHISTPNRLPLNGIYRFDQCVFQYYIPLKGSLLGVGICKTVIINIEDKRTEFTPLQILLP